MAVHSPRCGKTKTDESFQGMEVYVQSVHSALLFSTTLHVTSILLAFMIKKYNKLSHTGRRDAVVSTGAQFIYAPLYRVICLVTPNHLPKVYLHKIGPTCTDVQHQKPRLQISHLTAKISSTYWPYTLHTIASNLTSSSEPDYIEPTIVVCKSLQWLVQQKPRLLQYGGGRSALDDPTCLEPDTDHHIVTPRSQEKHRNQLVGGGYCGYISDTSSTTHELFYLNSPRSNCGTVALIDNSTLPITNWQPEEYLPVMHSDHPFDSPLTTSEFQQIMNTCRLPWNCVVMYSETKPAIYLTVDDIRNLISSNSMTNDDTMDLYLEIFCQHFHLSYVCPQIIPLLRTEGWKHVQRFFVEVRSSHSRTTHRPQLQGEPAIAIPCFVEGNHWVGLVRRESRGKVLFLYADDLNNLSVE
jgi:hypothetical protein